VALLPASANILLLLIEILNTVLNWFSIGSFPLIAFLADLQGLGYDHKRTVSIQ
jgi:hypothetical protein